MLSNQFYLQHVSESDDKIEQDAQKDKSTIVVKIINSSTDIPNMSSACNKNI